MHTYLVSVFSDPRHGERSALSPVVITRPVRRR